MPAPRPSRGCATWTIAATDIAALVELARREAVELTIIGPEAPLVAGIVDAFEAAGLRCFGPSRLAARLEGSKAFTKDFLQRHGIPDRGLSRASRATTTMRRGCARSARRSSSRPAAWHRARASSSRTAWTRPRPRSASMFGGRFGDAGAEIVIEQFLQGEEASFIVMADGEHVLPLATSQDHKRLRRRRCRSQHRRHGRLFAGPGGHAARSTSA